MDVPWMVWWVLSMLLSLPFLPWSRDLYSDFLFMFLFLYEVEWVARGIALPVSFF